MNTILIILTLVFSQIQNTELEGKWKITTLPEEHYSWEKVMDEASFKEISDKIVFTDKGEYILRSGDYKKSGLAELSFGYWKLQNDTLNLQSKFGDVLMFQFVLKKDKENFEAEMIYSFEYM